MFYALHSYGPNGAADAAQRLAKLPRCAPPLELPHAPAPPSPSPLQASFRALRASLEAEGYFVRDPLREAAALAAVLVLYAAAALAAPASHALATLLLGLGCQQAGWLAHDYIHGRGRLCAAMRHLGGILNGHSATWWVAKHSAHHVWTNTHGLDEDVTQEPLFYLEHPAALPAGAVADAPTRRVQHFYAYALYGITFWAWRVASVADVLRRRDALEAGAIALNAALMLTLYPVAVAAGGITLGGFLVGALVSATHQSEGVVYGCAAAPRPFVEAQFASTRDADAGCGPLGAAVAWLWGGMDTQLEHHLFPTMPRYRYAALRPRLRAWADQAGVEFRISGWRTIIADNYRTLRAAAAP